MSAPIPERHALAYRNACQLADYAALREKALIEEVGELEARLSEAQTVSGVGLGSNASALVTLTCTPAAADHAAIASAVRRAGGSWRAGSVNAGTT